MRGVKKLGLVVVSRFNVSWNKHERDDIVLAFEKDYCFNVESN